jgi:hypothetical protein
MTTAKKEKKPIMTGTRIGHITNLKQSILETFDIYVLRVPQGSTNRTFPMKIPFSEHKSLMTIDI